MNDLKQRLRPIVQRSLSPKTVQNLRFQFWLVASHYPRLVSSRTRKRYPSVHALGDSSRLADQLQAVNLLAPTAACRVMAKWGSDKAKHRYTPLYTALFEDRFDQGVKILELGLGTNNPNVLSNMGVFGAPGASLRGWRELFPNALVYGADIDRGILFAEDRIQTFYCDQMDQSSIRELWSQEELTGGADIIIEDGLHTFEANVSFLKGSLDQLRPGGIYVVEDIAPDCLLRWSELIDNGLAKEYQCEFAYVALADHHFNNLLVIRRPPGSTPNPSAPGNRP